MSCRGRQLRIFYVPARMPLNPQSACLVPSGLGIGHLCRIPGVYTQHNLQEPYSSTANFSPKLISMAALPSNLSYEQLIPKIVLGVKEYPGCNTDKKSNHQPMHNQGGHDDSAQKGNNGAGRLV